MHPTLLASSGPRRPASVNVRPLDMHYSDDDEQSPTAVREKHRWLLLSVPLAMSAAFFAAAIGTGTYWLLVPAAALGPWTLITGFLHLALSDDAEESAAKASH